MKGDVQMKQISVFLENKAGQLAAFTKLLSENGINLRALSLADTQDFGILRIIVEQPDKTVALLEIEGYAYSTTAVVAVPLVDKPGALAVVLAVCADNGISVEYAYAFLSSQPDTACLIIRTDDHDKTVKVLGDKGLKTATQEEIFKL